MRWPSFLFYPHIISDVSSNLDAHFEAKIVVFRILEAYKESDVQIIVVDAVAQFVEKAVSFGP